MTQRFASVSVSLVGSPILDGLRLKLCEIARSDNYRLHVSGDVCFVWWVKSLHFKCDFLLLSYGFQFPPLDFIIGTCAGVILLFLRRLELLSSVAFQLFCSGARLRYTFMGLIWVYWKEVRLSFDNSFTMEVFFDKRQSNLPCSYGLQWFYPTPHNLSRVKVELTSRSQLRLRGCENLSNVTSF